MRRYAGLSILCACVVAAEAQVRYQEVAQEAEIDFQHYNGAQGEYYFLRIEKNSSLTTLEGP